MVAVLIVLGVLGTLLVKRSAQGPWRDGNGQVHGTGEMVYRYPDGAIKLREEYVKGRLEQSQWFAPDGTLVFETDWEEESGVGVFLNDDGLIRQRMTFVDGIAEGPAWTYDERGELVGIAEYRSGSPVGEPPPLPAPDAPTPPQPMPEVPASALQGPFIGRWLNDTNVEIVIIEATDGSASLLKPETEIWTSVINNIRWEGESLVYDCYAYLEPDASISAHPFEGVRVTYRLRVGSGPDELFMSVESKQIPAPIEVVLRRDPE